MFEDFVGPATGAIVGFFLAQFVNIGKIFINWRHRPKLIIECCQENWILEPTERDTIYGLSVRNKGRRIATGVRVQLVKIVAKHDGDVCRLLSENAYDLLPYRQGSGEPVPIPLTLIPGSSVEIIMASRKDSDSGAYEDVIFPTVSNLPHLFEDLATGAIEYTYTVVVFDDKGNFSQKILSIQ